MMFLVVLDVRSKDVLVKERVDTAVRTLGNWSNRLEGAWLLESQSLGAGAIRDQLKPHLNDSDRLFVARISRNWAGRNMGSGFPQWMKRRDFGDFPNG